MTLGEKLRSVRRKCGFSQDAIGAQGFVSTPGWIKLENGQRLPSDQLIERFAAWLVEEKQISATAAKSLKADLLTLKYLAHSSPFVRALANEHAKTLPNGAALTAVKTPAKPARGRPRALAA